MPVGGAGRRAPRAGGVQDFERRESDLRGMRGVFVVGALMAVMGLMNAKNTASTIAAKRRIARKMRNKVARAT